MNGWFVYNETEKNRGKFSREKKIIYIFIYEKSNLTCCRGTARATIGQWNRDCSGQITAPVVQGVYPPYISFSSFHALRPASNSRIAGRFFSINFFFFFPQRSRYFFYPDIASNRIGRRRQDNDVDNARGGAKQQRIDPTPAHCSRRGSLGRRENFIR